MSRGVMVLHDRRSSTLRSRTVSRMSVLMARWSTPSTSGGSLIVPMVRTTPRDCWDDTESGKGVGRLGYGLGRHLLVDVLTLLVQVHHVLECHGLDLAAHEDLQLVAEEIPQVMMTS